MENDQNKKLLIVDDDAIVRMVHQIFFAKHYEVTLACNGEEALTLLTHKNFDAVLTDINMPQMDGFALTKEIRNLSSDNRHTVVIGITSTEPTEIADQAEKSGMNYIFKKPVELPIVEAQVNAFLTVPNMIV